MKGVWRLGGVVTALVGLALVIVGAHRGSIRGEGGAR